MVAFSTTDETPRHDRYSTNELTVSTILSISEDLDKKEHEDKNGGVKVESLYNGKSLESIKTIALSDSDITGETTPVDHEAWYTIATQVFIPFMIAGAGTIGAGLVLGNVENYEVFNKVNSLYVLVPALLGLKGNLDTCLASRMATQAHLGNMDSKRELIKIIAGNVGLVQVQAIIASSCAAVFAVAMSAIINREFNINDALLLAAAGMLTATMSCFILDFLLTAVIVFSYKLKLNPDNIAAPFAASIGDIVSLMVLSAWARWLYSIHDTHMWVLLVVLAFYIFLVLPTLIFFVRKNQYTKAVLKSGWTPVLTALIISGSGGLVLDAAVSNFAGYVVFQPIINGIGGNLVSVQSSRISTMLHKSSLKGVIPPHTKQWVWPWVALIKGVLPAKSARILVLMVIPGQTVFVFIADLIYNNWVSCVTPFFYFTYIIVCSVQVMILLYVAHLMTHTLWRFKIDPDSACVPYLTALGDLLGSSLLMLAFIFLQGIGHEYTPVVNST